MVGCQEEDGGEDDMSWKNQIKKAEIEAQRIIEDIQRVREIVRKLRKEYDIKTEHIDGLDTILVDLLSDIDEEKEKMT